MTDKLYHTVNLMMSNLGCMGQISARNPLVDDVMDALHDMDGGVYNESYKENEVLREAILDVKAAHNLENIPSVLEHRLQDLFKLIE